MLSVSYEWNGIPGIVVVAPLFKYYDQAGSAKIIEKETGMYSTYASNFEALEKSATVFAKGCIPFVEFWL